MTTVLLLSCFQKQLDPRYFVMKLTVSDSDLNKDFLDFFVGNTRVNKSVVSIPNADLKWKSLEKSQF